MPNWTSNTIRAQGAPEDLRAFLAAVNWKDRVFDFNRIIPMPEFLEHTATGRRKIDGEVVEAWYVIDPDELNRDLERVRCFTPDEEALLQEIGHRDWYDWSVAHWGTKWNACDPQVSNDQIETLGLVEIDFETAWCEPMPVFLRMFALFPK